MEEKRSEFFQEALSDFTFDVAGGRAICHLVDLGYSTAQIMERLDYPMPRARVEQCVYRYMKEKGILLDDLPEPEGGWQDVRPSAWTEGELYRCIRNCMQRNGEELSYVSCPFGAWSRSCELQRGTSCLADPGLYSEQIREAGKAGIAQKLSPLTSRERDYILGIPWEKKIMYHRLTSRMLEISVQLAVHSPEELTFYFLQSRERLRRV
jgi:hypothetical protein